MTNWFKTEDVGYYDEDGNVFIIERINQIFKYKKETISPVEIETILKSSDGVRGRCSAYALEDEYPKVFITKVPEKRSEAGYVYIYIYISFKIDRNYV